MYITIPHIHIFPKFNVNMHNYKSVASIECNEIIEVDPDISTLSRLAVNNIVAISAWCPHPASIHWNQPGVFCIDAFQVFAALEYDNFDDPIPQSNMKSEQGASMIFHRQTDERAGVWIYFGNLKLTGCEARGRFNTNI